MSVKPTIALLEAAHNRGRRGLEYSYAHTYMCRAAAAAADSQVDLRERGREKRGYRQGVF